MYKPYLGQEDETESRSSSCADKHYTYKPYPHRHSAPRKRTKVSLA